MKGLMKPAGCVAASECVCVCVWWISVSGGNKKNKIIYRKIDGHSDSTLPAIMQCKWKAIQRN